MIRNVKLKTMLVNCTAPVLSAFNRLVSKKQDQIFIYNANDELRDNSEALFYYLLENGYNRRYRILTNMKPEYVSEFPKAENVEYTTKNSALSDYLKSRYVFYSYGKIPVRPSDGQCVVNLWHGIPLKKIANLTDIGNGKEFFFTWLCASSELYRTIMARAFGCPEENVFITGEPKTDRLFREKENKETKLIVWTPTFRQSEQFGYDDSSKTELIPMLERGEWERFDSFLKENGVRMIVKLHNGQNLHGFYEEKLENLEIYSDKAFRAAGMDLYDVLSQSDALISDYSSVYLEYLVLNRPVCFAMEDFDEYSGRRGFVFDEPEKFIPGEKLNDREGRERFIKITAKGDDPYREERMRVNALVNAYADGKNCERVLRRAGIIEETAKS